MSKIEYLQHFRRISLEIWKGLIYQGKDLSDWYEVSTFGQLRNAKSKQIVNLHKIKTGYLTYCGSFGSRDRKKLIRIHKAVAETFIPNTMNYSDVNHKDGIKTHNNLENLEWCTHSENMKHAYRTGLADARHGESAANSKFTNEQANLIREICSNSNCSHRELARIFGIAHTVIDRIVTRQTYKAL